MNDNWAEPIQIWEWHNAPDVLRRHSDHGGDEDWVILVPPGGVSMAVEFFIDRNGYGDPTRVTLEDGSTLFIIAHS